MKITYLVNTMIMMEGRDSRVLCDPWVTFDAESNSGLYNFPETDYTRDEIAGLKPDFIYITHTHADHYDPDTLPLSTGIRRYSFHRIATTSRNVPCIVLVSRMFVFVRLAKG